MARRRQSSLGSWFLAVCWVSFALVSTSVTYGQTPLATQFEKDIVYCTHDGIPLKLDIAFPDEPEGTYPALVYISGSGWGHWWGESFDRHQYDLVVSFAASKGYVAATVDYRPTSILQNGKPKYTYPAQFVDVRAAVRWLRAHADKYHIDVNHIGAIGWSSGGHLSLMLGLFDGDKVFPGEDDNGGYSGSVEAVVSIAGATELADMYRDATYPGISDAIDELMGGKPGQKPEAYREASPLYYVTKGAPPVLLIQGDQDTEVPPNQATMFQQAMMKVGASVQLVMREGYGHQNDCYDRAIFPFFDSVLKGK